MSLTEVVFFSGEKASAPPLARLLTDEESSVSADGACSLQYPVLSVIVMFKQIAKEEDVIFKHRE